MLPPNTTMSANLAEEWDAIPLPRVTGLVTTVSRSLTLGLSPTSQLCCSSNKRMTPTNGKLLEKEINKLSNDTRHNDKVTTETKHKVPNFLTSLHIKII